MAPERRKIINGHKVEEYHWSREFPVYIDNYVCSETFEQACERLEKETENENKS